MMAVGHLVNGKCSQQAIDPYTDALASSIRISRYQCCVKWKLSGASLSCFPRAISKNSARH